VDRGNRVATSTEKSLLSWAKALTALATTCLACSAFAWVYPEHRDIAMLAVQGLDEERSAAFSGLWRQARQGDESRFCAEAADAKQGLTPECLDWAALSAIAGDHSCSPSEMLETVRKSDWILVVADIAAQLKADLERIPVTASGLQQSDSTSSAIEQARRRLTDEASRAKRMNALRTADTRLQRADVRYATRADANLAHFPLPRPDTNLDPVAYGRMALRPGAPINAAGVYVWYHLSALSKAARLAQGDLPEPQRRALARAMLFDEAFALHFLEDLFAAGHLAGSWGDVSQRKGTHDYYNENGLEVFTWSGRDKTLVLMGDAHMRPEDAAVVAKTVGASLEQVLDVAAGRIDAAPLDASGVPEEKLQPDGLDVCKDANFPEAQPQQGVALRVYRQNLRDVLLATPVPGLGPGLGTQPRARSEVGTYVGIAAAIEGRAISGGFLASQSGRGVMGGLDLGVRFGVGLEGALGETGDGRIFVQVGLHADTPSSNGFSESGFGTLGGSLTAAIPSRTGVSTRFRAPYYLIPGDLLLLAPLYWLSPATYTNMAVIASNGGLLGLQQGWASPIGLFQFVLGREIGVTWYGLRRDQQLIIPSSSPGGAGELVNFRSVYFDLPILEYRPYRAFSSNQSSSLLFQLYYGADVPHGVTEEGMRTGLINLRTVHSIGLRLVFDWRYYW
jgi:hypothetical protein